MAIVQRAGGGAPRNRAAQCAKKPWICLLAANQTRSELRRLHETLGQRLVQSASV